MNYPTHVIGGIGAGVIVNEFIHSVFVSSDDVATNLLFGSVFIASAVFGSLVPDIDKPNSKIGRKFKIISFSTSLVFGHRGLTHTPLFTMAILSLMFYLSQTFTQGFVEMIATYMTIGFGVGVVSHIILDSLTVAGVPLLYPFSKKTFSFLPIRTGSFMESVFAIGVIVSTCLFMAFTHQVL